MHFGGVLAELRPDLIFDGEDGVVEALGVMAVGAREVLIQEAARV